MPDEPALAELVAERQIRRVIYDYARGIDRYDLELVRACYWPDARDFHGAFDGTRDEFIDWVAPLLQRQTMTMHNLANIIIDLDGDRAGVETYGIAYHSGDPAGDVRWNYAAGFRYVDRFERRDGRWRIADRTTAIEWVTPWDADRERVSRLGRRAARRDREDPVYSVLPGSALPGAPRAPVRASAP
jgi:hypothetical protein